MSKDIIRKIALAVIKDRQLLMVRSHKNPEKFYTLGGKIENNENDIECLMREVKEEVASSIDPSSIHFLHEFIGEAHGKTNTKLIIRLYRGNLIEIPTASSEIAQIRYFDSSIDEKYLTSMAAQIFSWLKKNNYID